jgi:hypothetical protein
MTNCGAAGVVSVTTMYSRLLSRPRVQQAVRIQQRTVRANTGLDDARVYRELGAILAASINA